MAKREEIPFRNVAYTGDASIIDEHQAQQNFQQQNNNNRIDDQKATITKFEDINKDKFKLKVTLRNSPNKTHIFEHSLEFINKPQELQPNTIQISDSSVEQNHAKIQKNTQGIFEIEDLGTKSGTYIRIKKQFLSKGLILSIGESYFQVYSINEEENTIHFQCTSPQNQKYDLIYDYSADFSEQINIGKSEAIINEHYDEKMSSNHANLSYVNKQFLYQDSSTNGTWLKIKTQQLEDNSEIRIGNKAYFIVNYEE